MLKTTDFCFQFSGNLQLTNTSTTTAVDCCTCLTAGMMLRLIRASANQKYLVHNITYIVYQAMEEIHNSHAVQKTVTQLCWKRPKVNQDRVELHPFPLLSNIYGNLSTPRVSRPKHKPNDLGIFYFRPLTPKKLSTSCLQQKLKFWVFQAIFFSKSFLK